MALHRKGLLPIKIGHTELRMVFRKKPNCNVVFAKSLNLSFEVWFSFKVTVMNGSEV